MEQAAIERPGAVVNPSVGVSAAAGASADVDSPSVDAGVGEAVPETVPIDASRDDNARSWVLRLRSLEMRYLLQLMIPGHRGNGVVRMRNRLIRLGDRRG